MLFDGFRPSGVFHFFEEISKIPRCSGNEEAVSGYITRFAREKGLKYKTDPANNVLIEKEAAPGYENSPGVILQAHMDMVCEKDENTSHDFAKDPLRLRRDGDFIYAEGTTLGADNGIGVAYMLAILDSPEIPHPRLECIFTADEERGMGGAIGFDAASLKGRYMINLDTEGEGKLLVGCCGGLKARISLTLALRPKTPGLKPYELLIKGLKGGHSGADIIFQRANSNKLMGRLLRRINRDFNIEVSEISGGMADNAIPREARAIFFADKGEIREINLVIGKMREIFENEYKYPEGEITVSLLPCLKEYETVFEAETLNKAISLLILIPSGIIRMDFNIPGLVETSTNLGIVRTEGDKLEFISALRSSVESKKYEMLDVLSEAAGMAGAELSVSGEYPGWEYKPDSRLLSLFSEVFFDMYGKKPEVLTIHAGVECGIFADKNKELDMISVGPDIFDIHSPREKMSLSSALRVYEYILRILSLLK